MEVKLAGDVKAYRAVLDDLRDQRAKLDTAIAAIEALMPVETVDEELYGVFSRGPQIVKRLEGRFAGMTIIDASMKVLEEASGPIHVSSIVEAIVHGGVSVAGDASNTVGSILNRRARDKGDVIRIGRGTWALPNHKLTFEHLNADIDDHEEEIALLDQKINEMLSIAKNAEDETEQSND